MDALGLWAFSVGFSVGGRGIITGSYEAGFAIDGCGHAGIYSTATGAVGAGHNVGASLTFGFNKSAAAVNDLAGGAYRRRFSRSDR